MDTHPFGGFSQGEAMNIMQRWDNWQYRNRVYGTRRWKLMVRLFNAPAYQRWFNHAGKRSGTKRSRS